MLFGVCANGRVYARKQTKSQNGYGLGEFYDATNEIERTFKELQQNGVINKITNNLRPKNNNVKNNALVPAKSVMG